MIIETMTRAEAIDRFGHSYFVGSASTLLFKSDIHEQWNVKDAQISEQLSAAEFSMDFSDETEACCEAAKKKLKSISHVIDRFEEHLRKNKISRLFRAKQRALCPKIENELETLYALKEDLEEKLVWATFGGDRFPLVPLPETVRFSPFLEVGTKVFATYTDWDNFYHEVLEVSDVRVYQARSEADHDYSAEMIVGDRGFSGISDDGTTLLGANVIGRKVFTTEKAAVDYLRDEAAIRMKNMRGYL